MKVTGPLRTRNIRFPHILNQISVMSRFGETELQHETNAMLWYCQGIHNFLPSLIGCPLLL